MQAIGRILVIDDDKEFLSYMSQFLGQAGYTVHVAESGTQGLRRTFEERPDLILLDVMMPGMDGFEACARIREITDIPVVMLTSRQMDEDIVRGLEVGADDYITKSTNPDIIRARINAVIRRAKMPPAGGEQAIVYKDEWLHIDIPRHLIEVQGKRLALSATEFNLLALLVKHSGDVLSFEQILTNVWGPEYKDEVAYVRVYISHLRQKIEPDPSNPTYILTERQVGYRFIVPR
ncbi:MAG: response regulator transcription factor [Anaerolineae bacterium]|nr:response regulator transcription factor [Anaerolineae bacterium]